MITVGYGAVSRFRRFAVELLRISPLRASIGAMALALAACSPSEAGKELRLKNSEANDIRYMTVRMVLDWRLKGWEVARKAIADGMLTNGEYDAVMAAGEGPSDKSVMSACYSAKANTAKCAELKNAK